MVISLTKRSQTLKLGTLIGMNGRPCIIGPDQLGYIMDIKLAHQIRAVVVYSLDRQSQIVSDDASGTAFGYGFENLLLAVG